MYLSLSLSVYIYIYIYIYDIPPLIINPPNKKPPLGGGKQIFVTINLAGGTITPLIRNICWFDLHKKRCLVKPPPNTQKMWFC